MNVIFTKEVFRRIILWSLGLFWTGLLVVRAATLEDVSPQFGTNTAIIWKAHTNHLSARYWTYTRSPQVFSAAAISNAIVLAGFEKKGFPRPTTNDVVLWADHSNMEPKPPSFCIFPKYGEMSFTLGDRIPDPPDALHDEAAVKRAFKCVALLGVNEADLLPTNTATSAIYGVFLTRRLDGVPFVFENEGFQIQFGRDAKIRQFALSWPKLERDEYRATATPEEMIRCIRGRKTPVLPVDDEPDYFARIRRLAHARKLTITGITAYYNEGRYGEEPRANEPPNHITPIVELDALADFGTNSVSLKLYSPILSVDVKKLMESSTTIKKSKPVK
jgi:hypothetical protein